eukprot:9333135-Alexandrium_andersonii.AAC.1
MPRPLPSLSPSASSNASLPPADESWLPATAGRSSPMPQALGGSAGPSSTSGWTARWPASPLRAG